MSYFRVLIFATMQRFWDKKVILENVLRVLNVCDHLAGSVIVGKAPISSTSNADGKPAWT